MNVLVLSLNPCNLGYLGCYGNQWIQTPALDRFAAESLVFDQYFSENVDPRITRRAWWNGRYAVTHESTLLMPQILSTSGIRTRLIADAACLAGSPALLGGFGDVFTVPPANPQGPPNLPRLVDAAVDWLETRDRSDPFLLWLDANTLCPPWQPPEPFASIYDESIDDDEPDDDEDNLSDPDELESARYRYAGQVSYVDSCVHKLLDHLHNRGDHRTTAVIVLSDRGMPLGEHRAVGFEPALLYEELVHVPLLIRMPDRRGAGTRSATFVQPVDLAPTILELFGLSQVRTLHGASLVPLFESATAKVRDAAVASIPNQARSLRTAQWHLITPTRPEPSVHEAPSAPCPHPSPELYLKPEDRWDQHNVAALYPEEVERLTAALEQFAQAIAADRIDQAISLLHTPPVLPQEAEPR